MELFEDSKNFHDFLNSCGGRLSPGNALEIFSQICRGVKALHTLKIVHRDLKPANVLIQTDPIRIKVIDFGYAKLIRGGNDHFLSIAGSPVYMSP
jgi:serine/threonine protein kinase